ncbi:MAG: MFS transporter [Clostridia bacterium]|nr:MFS transporter [Clostridia bacterium]
MTTQTKTKEKRYVGVKETLLYGIANGGQCIGYNMMTAQRSFFLVSVFGVPEAVVSLMLTVMAFWDAFNDPLMGAVVDKTRTRYGKLRPYLMFVPVFLGITTVLFFGGPVFLTDAASIPIRIVYMCITYFIWEFFYTIGDIPFWGLSSAISPSPLDRSRVIKSARLISGIIGGIPGIIITVCLDLSRNGTIPLSLSQIFLILSIVAGTFGMYLFSLAGTKTKERVVYVNDEPKLSECFAFMFKNKPLMLIMLSNLISTVEGIGGTFSVYYYYNALGVNSLSLLAGIPGTVMGWVTYPLMTILEKRWTSRQIVVRVSFMHAGVTALVFLLGSRYYTNMGVIVPLLMLHGVSNAINCSIKSVIPTKMISETVDYMEYKTGKRNEGMAFSVLTFMGKLTGTLSTALGTALIPVVGLVRDSASEMMVVSESSPINTQFWLWALITIIPTTLGLLALIPYKFYDLEGAKLENIQKEVQIRREAISKELEEEEA